MRLLIQRVSRAAVRARGRTLAEIGPGLLVLAGCGRNDREDEPRSLAGKVFHLRIFPDGEGKMNLSVGDVGGSVLVVPQFTLYGDASRGRRPSWAGAAPPEEARGRVDAFVRELQGLGARVERGAFGEHMDVESVNDGPVTILLEG